MSFRNIFFVLILIIAWPVNAISVKTISNNDSSVINNINAYLSVYAAPEECRISDKYLKKIYVAINKSLEALGYYRYEIVELNPLTKDDCQQWEINLVLETKAVISELVITLDGEGKDDRKLTAIVDTFPLKVGEYLDHENYEQGKTRLVNAALLNGYFDFTFSRKEVLVDRENNNVNINLEVSTGKRYLFGDILSDLDPEHAKLVDDLKPFSFGEPYEAQKLTNFIQRLKQSSYFRNVIVRPVIQKAKNNVVPLELIYKLKPQDEFDIGGGYSSDTRLRGKLNWRHPIVNAAGHSIEAELFVSAPEQSLALKYRIPLVDPANNFLSFQAGVLSVSDNDTNSDTYTLAAKRHWVNRADAWQKVAFIRFDLEQFSQGGEGKESTFLLVPGYTFSRTQRDDELDPSVGNRQMLTLEVASKNLLSDIDFARITAHTKWLFSVSEHQFLLKAELGALATNEFINVPSTLRYFAGGDQSVRGFGYQSLSPIDEQGQLTGGKYLYTTGAEYSVPIAPNWRVALFADAGNAGNKLFENVATGVGTGISWLSPIGSIRLYIARGNSDIEKTWRIHFTMGSVPFRNSSMLV